MAKFSNLLEQKVTYSGLVGVTFQLDHETKFRVDEIAAALRRSSADVYRELVRTGLPDLEAEMVAHLKKVMRP